MILCPKFIFACRFHLPAALGTGVEIPSADIHATAQRAQSSSLAVERGSHLTDDSTYNDILYRVAVAALHRYYLLLKQSATFIQFNFVTA